MGLAPYRYPRVPRSDSANGDDGPDDALSGLDVRGSAWRRYGRPELCIWVRGDSDGGMYLEESSRESYVA